MANYLKTALLLFGVTGASPGGARAETVSVTQWLMAVDVFADAANNAAAFFGVVTNPLVDSHQVSVLNSSAAASYDFWWDDTGAHFRVDGSQAAQGAPYLTAGSSGSPIRFTPLVDMVATYSGSYSYDLAAGDREAKFDFSLGRLNPSISLASHHFSALTIIGDPPQGTWTYSGSVPLEANVPHVFSYNMRLNSFTGSPTSLSFGSGFIQLDLVPVPEPSLASALLIGAALPRRRSRRN
jgi:hypothetical protein